MELEDKKAEWQQMSEEILEEKLSYPTLKQYEKQWPDTLFRYSIDRGR